jgi:hypothetical protein
MLDTGKVTCRKANAEYSIPDQEKECPPQATPAAQKRWRATAHKNGTVTIPICTHPMHICMHMSTWWLGATGYIPTPSYKARDDEYET